MKLTGYKRLEKAPRLTAAQKWAFVPLCLLFFLLGSNGLLTPLNYLIFDMEYSGMAITEIAIGLLVGIPLSVYNERYRRYIVAAIIAFGLGCLLTYGFIAIALPGELITGMQ